MNYISKYSNGKEVSAAQYITELICENKAKQEKKDLHFKFWTNKEWARFYRDQIATANKLVKKYNEQAIVKALKSKKAEKIYSLRAPHLPAIIEYEQSILETTNTTLSKEFDRSEKKKYRQNEGKSIISKLKELE
jgi:hypothetical protein